MLKLKRILLVLSLALLFTFLAISANAAPNDVNNDVFYKEVSQIVSSNWDDSYFSEATLSVGSNTIEVDGNIVKLDNLVEIQNGELILPSEMLNEIGVQVSYDSKHVSMKKKNQLVEVNYGEKSMKVNGRKKGMVNTVSLRKGKPVLPASVLTEQGLGFEINYEESTGTVYISNKYQMARILSKVVLGKTAPKGIEAKQTIVGPDGLYVYQFDTEEQAKLACEILNASPDIEYAEPDMLVTLNIESDYALEEYALSGVYSHLGWGSGRIGSDAYLDYLFFVGKQNATVTVAVLDTGLDTSHPFFTGRHVPGRNIVSTSLAPQDVYSHGTHVAGTIVDVTIALPNVKIMPVKVLGDDGRGTSANVANGIRWATDNGAKVINMSLGGGHAQTTDDAVAYAIGKNVTVVVSAGNDAVDAKEKCPAHIEAAITVSSFDSTDKPAGTTNYGICVDVAAPGVNIISTIPGGKTGMKSGTSMAAPHVSGAVAMLLCDNPSLSPKTTEELIRINVDPITLIGDTRYYGSGILHMRVPVIDIINVSDKAIAGTSLPLVGTVVPDFATSKDIVWSVKNAGSTGASISGNVLNTSSAGSVVVTAIIMSGKSDGDTFTKDFTIAVNSPVLSTTPTYYVSKTGNNNTGDGSSAKPWGTIQYGINKLKAGDTLIIREGKYNEKLTIGVSGTAEKYITIKGEPGKRVFLDGTGAKSSDGMVLVYMLDRSYVRIENLEICNNYTPNGGWTPNIGIHVVTSRNGGSTGIQLVGNKIYNIDGETNHYQKSGDGMENGNGIVVVGAGNKESNAIKDLLIEGNEVYNCKVGCSNTVMVTGNITNWKILNNYIHDNDSNGIVALGGEDWVLDEMGKGADSQLNRAHNGLIAGNVVVSNNGINNRVYNSYCSGIYVEGGKDIVIENNYVTGSAYGIGAGENGSSYKPSGIITRNNVVFGNVSAGITLGSALDVLVEYNTVYQTKGRGIEIDSGSGPYTVKSNIIMTAKNIDYFYVGKKVGTPTYVNNVYYGGSTSKPSGDSNGQVVTTLPVTNQSGYFTPNVNVTAGARLTIDTTPFLFRVISS